MKLEIDLNEMSPNEIKSLYKLVDDELKEKIKKLLSTDEYYSNVLKDLKN